MTQANLLLYNATIYTMDEIRPVASAIAIQDGHIVGLGTRHDARARIAGGCRELNLNGATVLPGLIDCHLHFAGYGRRLNSVNVYEVPTLQDALDRVAERIAQTTPGTWVQGGGWNCNLWDDGAFPHRRDLDRVAPHHPVVLSSKDGHSTWVNSRALGLAGITAHTPDPPGGHIRRDAHGEPTGVLQERAAELIYRAIPEPTLKELIAALRLAQRHAHAVGLTGIHNCEGQAVLTAFQELWRLGEQSIRVLMHVPHENLDAAIQVGVRDGLGDEWLRIAGVKVFADGALGSRSAWMLAPYEGDPDNLGIPTITPDELRYVVSTANAAGLSVAIHAIGDAANRAVLDAIQESNAPENAHLRNRHWGSRARTGYAWRSLLDAGTMLAFGSDAPVEDISPLRGIYAAVTRRRPDGYPAAEGWYPEQRLTAAEAVYAYTLGAAYASGEERLKGSLSPGKLADLVVLDRDILGVDPQEILETSVLGTMVGGRWVYRGGGL